MFVYQEPNRNAGIAGFINNLLGGFARQQSDKRDMDIIQTLQHGGAITRLPTDLEARKFAYELLSPKTQAEIEKTKAMTNYYNRPSKAAELKVTDPLFWIKNYGMAGDMAQDYAERAAKHSAGIEEVGPNGIIGKPSDAVMQAFAANLIDEDDVRAMMRAKAGLDQNMTIADKVSLINTLTRMEENGYATDEDIAFRKQLSGSLRETKSKPASTIKSPNSLSAVKTSQTPEGPGVETQALVDKPKPEFHPYSYSAKWYRTQVGIAPPRPPSIPMETWKRVQGIKTDEGDYVQDLIYEAIQKGKTPQEIIKALKIDGVIK